MDELKDKSQDLDQAIDGFNEQLDRYKSGEEKHVGKDMQDLGSALDSTFNLSFARMEKKLEAKLKSYDEGINTAMKRANSAHVLVGKYRGQIMTAIKTTGWTVGIISGIAGVISLMAIVLGR